MTTTDTDIFDDLYGSKYFSATDLHGETVRRRIGKVDVVELKEKDGSTKRKFVCFFEGVEKPLVLNKTNATKLAASYGKDRLKWIGVVVELYGEMTSLGKEGVRLRPLKSAAAGAAAGDMSDAIPF
jgi:hypothetical protein